MRAECNVREFVLARCAPSTSSVGGGPNNPSLCKTGTGTSGVPVASFSRRGLTVSGASFSRRGLTARAYTRRSRESRLAHVLPPRLSLSLSYLPPLSLSVSVGLCLCSLCLCLLCSHCLCLRCLSFSVSLFLRLCETYVATS